MSLRKHIDTLLRKFEKNYTTYNRIEVSQSAMLHNFDFFTQLYDKPVIPVLKGNAYGHGITLITKILKTRKFPYIAVDGYFEALRIREVSDQPVLIMGAIPPKNYQRLAYDNFAFVVHDLQSIHALGKTCKHIKVHVEVNTGMNRYGAKAAELKDCMKLILHYKNLTLEGVMSHLADSDGTNPSTVDKAVQQFDLCIASIVQTGAHPTLFHIAQTAGGLKAHSKYANAFRLGIGLYGINPFPQNHILHKRLKNVKPALTVISTITKVIQLQKGDQVGYNYAFTAPKDMKIGVLPFGYYEGLPRAFSNSGIGKVGKHFTAVISNICMNHTMISLENISAKVGDEVIIYSNQSSDQNTVDNLAYKYNLLPYNLLSALNQDVRRILVK